MLPIGYILPPNQRPTASCERYTPCWSLLCAGVPCVVLFEDASAYHGVPTCLFDLYILVDDIDAAATVIARDPGWVPVATRKNTIGNSTVDVPLVRLGPPSEGSTTPTHEPSHIVLLRARDWFFNLTDVEESFFPPLLPLLNALYRTLFEGTYGQRQWTSLHLSYLYGHTLNWRNWKDKKPIPIEDLCEAARPVHLDVRLGWGLTHALLRKRLGNQGKMQPGRLGTDYPPHPEYESRYGVLPGPWSWRP